MITNYNNHQIGPFTPVGIWTPPRLGSAAPFTWTPSDITSITTKLYLEGDSKTVSGSTLLSAVDKSGNGNNYAGNNMTWAADPTANNQDVFQFNGSTGYLDRSSTQIHPNYAAACTHIIFFEPSDLPGSGDFRIISTFNTDLSGGNQGYFNYISSGAIGSQLPMSSGRIDPLLCDHERYDAVIALSKLQNAAAVLPTFREFIVYDGNQCYPEFLITYERH